MKDIYHTLREADRFPTLIEALEAVELSGMLSGPGPFTLFAPVEEAFEKLHEEKRRELSNNKWKVHK